MQDHTGGNEGRIDAFQGIDSTHDSYGPPSKYSSTINEGTSMLNADDFHNEDEVNSNTVRAKIL